MIGIEIEMPKCCAYCPIYDRSKNMCNATKEYLFTHEFWESRYPKCPLSEVKNDNIRYANA